MPTGPSPERQGPATSKQPAGYPAPATVRPPGTRHVIRSGRAEKRAKRNRTAAPRPDHPRGCAQPHSVDPARRRILMREVGTQHEPHAHEDHEGETDRVDMQPIEPHPDGNDDCQHGLEIGVDTRYDGLHELEGEIEQQIRHVGRGDQHEKYREEHLAARCDERVIRMNDVPDAEREHHDGRRAIDPPEHRRDVVLGHQLLEPDHIERSNARTEENHDIAPKMRVDMRRRCACEHHGHGAGHAQYEPRDLEPRESVDAEHDGEQQDEQRDDGVDDRTVDRRGHRQTVHDEDLAGHADQQSGADQLRDVASLDLLGLLPEERDERKESRNDQRSRDHGDRLDIAGKHEVIERIVHRPNDVADKQGDMRNESGSDGTHVFDFPSGKTKTVPEEVRGCG